MKKIHLWTPYFHDILTVECMITMFTSIDSNENFPRSAFTCFSWHVDFHVWTWTKWTGTCRKFIQNPRTTRVGAGRRSIPHESRENLSSVKLMKGGEGFFFFFLIVTFQINNFLKWFKNTCHSWTTLYMGSHCFKGNLCHYVSNEVTYWSQLSVKSDLMRLFFTRFLVCKLMSTYMYKSIRSKTKMKLNLLTCSLARSLLVFLTVMWYFPLLWLTVEVTFRFDFCNWPLLLLQNDSWEKLENATKKKR